MVNKDPRQRELEIWRELAERAALEQDHVKRVDLCQQFNRVLAQDEASRGKGQ
jgi:hypothetical protein